MARARVNRVGCACPLFAMNPLSLPTDDLFQLERRIARRADALSRRFGVDRGHDLQHWRQAEREVWSALAPRTESGADEPERGDPVPVQR